jgi:hypothetical protein
MTLLDVDTDANSVSPVVKGTEYDKLIHSSPFKNKSANNVTK